MPPAPQKPRGFNSANSQILYLASKWRIFFKMDPDRHGPVVVPLEFLHFGSKQMTFRQENLFGFVFVLCIRAPLKSFRKRLDQGRGLECAFPRRLFSQPLTSFLVRKNT